MLGTQDPTPRPDLADVVLYLVGVAGLAAGLTLLFLGMRAVMDVGGMCADGGPYVSAQACPTGTPLVMMLAIFGGLASAGLAGYKGAALGPGYAGIVTFAWPALFGSLGWNFLQYGVTPPGDSPGPAIDWLVCGVVFEAMAIGPLALGLLAWREGRRSGAPRSTLAPAPGGAALVRAAHARAARRAAAAAPGSVGSTLPSPTVEPGTTAAPTDLVPALERLAALREQGDLTAEEFAAAKAALIKEAGS